MLNIKDLKVINKFSIFSKSMEIDIKYPDRFFSQKYFIISAKNPYLKDLEMLINIFFKYSEKPSLLFILSGGGNQLLEEFLNLNIQNRINKSIYYFPINFVEKAIFSNNIDILRNYLNSLNLDSISNLIFNQILDISLTMP